MKVNTNELYGIAVYSQGNSDNLFALRSTKPGEAAHLAISTSHRIEYRLAWNYTQLMFNNGVTRATRIHYLAPGQLVTVEVTEVKPKAKFSRLLRVRDVAPTK